MRNWSKENHFGVTNPTRNSTLQQIIGIISLYSQKLCRIDMTLILVKDLFSSHYKGSRTLTNFNINSFMNELVGITLNSVTPIISLVEVRESSWFK